ncbi:thiamine biosynthesis protein ThiF [Planococcus salinarum]|uniref:Thiamine biosynthesis protein ThiF n=1 Tax=Planococcus salinarum TaxID=622695 RepID=A0ABX3D1T0_9BACL|nr:ThiF family adenylyltransferase [Planococcus salinarum]OHX53917.1 thiamine biosynthesis protein ThiF [Planococcus salinarum]TAA73033.1 thiazole biosynthesis adenylyltransferase ThiF [Planococcus salinarum]
MEDRYSRQTLFKPIGASGQTSIQEAVITIIGCGALGSAIAESMARAGVGEIHLVDRDYVEFSNLQRQQLFTEVDAAAMTPKVVAAEKRLKAIRTHLKLHTYLENLGADLMEKLIKKSTLVMDATDNFETRLLINDASVKYGVPWIYGACVGSSGAVFPFVPGKGSCFRCLVPVLPAVNETCDTVGIISPAVQITAALQCAEAMKWLSGNEQAMRKKVHYFNVWDNSQYDIGIARIKNAQCETCGENPAFPSLMRSSEGLYAVLCGREAVQILPDPTRTITLDDAEFAANRMGAEVKRTPYFVQLRALGYRMVFFGDGRMIIHGIRNAADGRKIYHQLFG